MPAGMDHRVPIEIGVSVDLLEQIDDETDNRSEFFRQLATDYFDQEKADDQEVRPRGPAS